MSYLEWAKTKGPNDLLSHSSIDVPLLGDMVNSAYCTEEFLAMLREDNQWGLRRLKNAIAKRYGIEDNDDEPTVLLTPGASSGIYLVCKTFLSDGDEVILESPTYEPFITAIETTGAQIIWWHRRGPRFTLDPNHLLYENLLTERTKLVFISNPHNPSGSVLPDQDLQHLAQAVKRGKGRDVKIVVDEIYRDLTRNTFNDKYEIPVQMGKQSAKSAVQFGNEFISINSLSKVYGLSRIRTGWILGTPDVIAKIRRTYETVINIGALDTEAISAIVFDRLDTYLLEAQHIVNENRQVLRNELSLLIADGTLWGEIPEYGCTYFPRLGARFDHLHPETIQAVVASLETNCGVVPGSYFGNQFFRHFRIGLGGDAGRFRTEIANLKDRLTRSEERTSE